MEYSDKEKKEAMATARNNGAVSSKAVVPKVVRKFAHKNETIILDYGCGQAKKHVAELLQEGYIVEGYDFSLPHTAVCLKGQYDMVYLSNVLNVQSSLTMLDLTLRQVAEVLYRTKLIGGDHFRAKAIINYPTTPRKLNINTKAMQTILETYFYEVHRCPYSEVGNNIVWICSGPWPVR